MNGLRFKVGELAIIGVCAYQEAIGRTVEITEVGPFPPGHLFADGVLSLIASDYLVALDGEHYICADWMLVKLDPPAEPVEMTRFESVTA